MLTTRQGRAAFMRAATVAVLLMATIGVRLFAHEITVKGTVAAVERTRIQVKTGEEKKGDGPAWYSTDAKTKFLRGRNTVTRDQAKIVVGEKVVVIVDHEAGGVMKALEIRLAAR